MPRITDPIEAARLTLLNKLREDPTVGSAKHVARVFTFPSGDKVVQCRIHDTDLDSEENFNKLKSMLEKYAAQLQFKGQARVSIFEGSDDEEVAMLRIGEKPVTLLEDVVGAYA